jgi:hypothetical protein
MDQESELASDYDREVLAHFAGSVRRHFGDVIAKFHFVETQVQIRKPDIWLKLQNKSTQLMINYEWGVGCWVTVGRLSRWLPRRVAEYSLENIVRAAAPTAVFPDVHCPEYDRDCVDESLQRLASVARAHGAAVLSGDFSSLSRPTQ